MADPVDIDTWRRLDARTTTSGQPTEAQLGEIAAIGVRHVVNLALHSHERALPDEAASVAALGMTYTHIPVPFDAPDDDHFERFRGALAAAGGEAVHVHCIVNYRVSAFFYRYRRDVIGIDETVARAAMDEIWQPETIPAWRAFIAAKAWCAGRADSRAGPCRTPLLPVCRQRQDWERQMLSIARYGTHDLDRARVFYDEIAALLGAKRVNDRPELSIYQGPEGGMFIIGTPLAGEASVGNGSQLCFAAATRDVVDAVHARALALGGKDEGAPGIRGERPDGFYAAYFRDLDGNKLVVFRIEPP